MDGRSTRASTRARFTPTEDGIYKVVVGGTDKDGKDVGRGNADGPRRAERRRVLRRGDARAAARAHRRGNRRPLLHGATRPATLVDAITYSGKGITVVEEQELWDMPIMLLLLLTLMGGEWSYRRSARAGVEDESGDAMTRRSTFGLAMSSPFS